ncbi:acyl-homoserine-lactone synthase [Sagittula salina]|uniref:Acyl-homoserine-lactone synthase n=1 Tax=Sagittula salina TaxID=2820268 RepID=A0A940MPT9_9RHOB|nr:acyl-homoserine-lactone synthase [Sagittula salina]MBP0483630.1 autoinducer synthase [Sagittula salina]
MIRFARANELPSDSPLLRSMYRDRATQFRDRLKWDVTVDDRGEEHDQYDALDPLYVIWEREDGLHGGSMRFLPTLGRCMVNEHFLHVTGGRTIRNPGIWECTRFCLAPDSKGNVAAALMLAGGELMRQLEIEKFVGVFDARMVRIYSRIGASPEVIGSVGEGRDQVSVGLWAFSEPLRERVAQTAGISPAQSQAWSEASPLAQGLRAPIAA